jgi:response regulator RpfG family c-di-GMP phosphodiesterase
MESHAAGLPATGTSTQDLAELGEVAQHPSVPNAVAAVRAILNLDVAYLTEITETQQIVREVAGDGASFGLAPDASFPLEETLCHRVLAGRLPSVIPVVSADDRAKALPAVRRARIGTFVSVPVVLPDGERHGTLCAAGHEGRPDLGYRDLQVMHVLGRMIADLLHRETLTERLATAEREAALTDVLARVVDERDAHAGLGHEMVLVHAVALARRLGLDADEVDDVRRLAVLHDIGKLSLPDGLLHKPGPLGDAEWSVLRGHSERGEATVAAVAQIASLAPLVRAGHERWDGTGYPDGLAGHAIPMASRIVLVCDAYEAMLSERPHRPALTPEDARAEIKAGLGTQFCPIAGQAFLNILTDR